MTPRFRWLSIALMLTICLLDGTSSAQEPAATAVFSERIEVNIVEVLVRVTDKDGNPVRGLTRDDFQIFEDGDPIQVTNFLAVEDRQVVQQLVANAAEPQGSEDTSGMIDLNASTDVPDESLVEVEAYSDESDPLFLAVFIDNTTLQYRNRKKALASVAEFFNEGLGEYDNVLIATLDDEYRILQGFTNDPKELADALGSLKKQSSQGDQKEADFRNLVRDLQGEVITPQTAPFKSERTKVQIDMHARNKQADVRQAIGALSYLMSTLSGVPGQRAMLYVGEGLPMRPAEALRHAHFNKYSNTTDVDPPETTSIDFDLTKDFEQFVAHAQTSGIEFWAIDAAGKRPGFGGSAEFSMGERDSALASGLEMAWNQRLDIMQTRNVQSTLQLAAGDTGGEVMVNTRDYSSFLQRMRDSLDNFYSIGYAAPHAKEGGMHKIRVEMTRKDLKAHFQRGYRDKTWNQMLTDTVISQLLLGVGENPLGVAITAGEPTIDGNDATVEVLVTVRLDRLTLIPQGDSFVGSASMVLLSRDAIGNASSPRIVPMQIHLSAEQMQGDGPGKAEAKVELVLRRGPGAIGVGIRDDFAEIISTTTTDISL